VRHLPIRPDAVLQVLNESESVTSAVGYGYNQDDIEESFRDRPVLYKPFEPAQLHAALVRAKK
jgi:hypothetical protein